MRPQAHCVVVGDLSIEILPFAVYIYLRKGEGYIEAGIMPEPYRGRDADC
jgi:hypothetical protein